jgi:hypothetical protein
MQAWHSAGILQFYRGLRLKFKRTAVTETESGTLYCICDQANLLFDGEAGLAFHG